MEGQQQKPIRVLSLDGGGVRGLSTILILQHIQQIVIDMISDGTIDQCHEIFDMIGGTSTGG